MLDAEIKSGGYFSKRKCKPVRCAWSFALGLSRSLGGHIRVHWSKDGLWLPWEDAIIACNTTKEASYPLAHRTLDGIKGRRRAIGAVKSTKPGL